MNSYNKKNNIDFDDKIMKKTKNKKQETKSKELELSKVEHKLNDVNFKIFRDNALSELSLKLKQTSVKQEDNK